MRLRPSGVLNYSSSYSISADIEKRLVERVIRVSMCSTKGYIIRQLSAELGQDVTLGTMEDSSEGAILGRIFGYYIGNVRGSNHYVNTTPSSLLIDIFRFLRFPNYRSQLARIDNISWTRNA